MLSKASYSGDSVPSRCAPAVRPDPRRLRPRPQVPCTNRTSRPKPCREFVTALLKWRQDQHEGADDAGVAGAAGAVSAVG